ncbi:hypothetical protein IPM62_03085 [Candidatus Woesebacteria bacterium]|nr:MAG: hypothetical protein IPM62_03085 [Candidatus Woesebacteria bacterium]
MTRERTYAAEVEKPISNAITGESHSVSQDFFENLATQARNRGEQPNFHDSNVEEGVHLGVQTKTFGEQGLDNGFNNQETALPYTTNLNKLADTMHADVQSIQEALEPENGTAINMSNHPLGNTDRETYNKCVAPKGVYPYLWHRGWDHSAGIDAKAQLGPTTGVSPEEAADAFSVIVGTGAAFVGITANSPFAEGKASGYKESRLTMWDRMMKHSTVPGDRRTARFPEKRIWTMADYFNWMHGEDTGIHFISDKDYKTGGIITIDGNPPVLDYLKRKKWQGREFGTDNTVQVTPQMSHMSAMQFSQFAGARIRYGLQKEAPVDKFLAAMENNRVEEYFRQHSEFVYIEGRDPGTNMPDKHLNKKGGTFARSVMMTSSAMQAGLINNLPEATALINRYDWQTLRLLRDAAIKDGLQGEIDGLTVKQFAGEVLEVAEQGLGDDEKWMLSYANHVVETGKNGADRAIEQVGDNQTRASIASMVVSRNVIVPPRK